MINRIPIESLDALIVGGGPAGSSCARVLSRAGFKVLLLDKSEFPRSKVCAGWITPQVIEALELDTEDYRRARAFQPITAFATGIGRRAARRVAYGREVSFGIRRCEFDEYLLRRCGAALKLGVGLESLRRESGQWIANEVLRAPLLIGAGGHFCPVARHLGAALGRGERALAAQEVEFELSPAQAADCRIDAQMPELYFCEDLRGYAWCFRKGNFLNVGLGRDESHALPAQLQEFWEFLRAQAKVPQDSAPRFKGHAYLTRAASSRALLDEGVMLIGDAAGLAYAESGEGIRPAVESGIIAAEVAISAGGDYSRARLEAYGARLRQRFGPGRVGPGRASPGRDQPAAGHLGRRAKAALARRLLQTDWFTRRVVVDRWFLHSHQAALIAPSHARADS